MKLLGHLVWFTVGEFNLTHPELAFALKGTGVHIPNPPIPVDVFRRLVHTKKRYGKPALGGLEATVVEVPSTSKRMMTHHLVGKVERDGKGTIIRKIGEATFYVPPRGEHSKSRCRVVPAHGGMFDAEAKQFADYLRHEYEIGVKGALEGQSIRRIIRLHLAAAGGIWLHGPWFFTGDRDEVMGPLDKLFTALGDRSFIFDVPYEDTERNRQFLTRVRDSDA